MIQITIVFGYLLLTIIIGIVSKRRSLTSTAFFGADFGVLLCVVAGAGEWLGGTATTGVSEYGFLYGLSGAWYTIANGLGVCFLAVFFARMFRRIGTITVSGIMGKYIGGKSRKVSAAILIFIMMAVGISQMVAAGTLGETLFGISPTAALFVMGGAVLLYTVLGGMIAVGYTNVAHVVIMYAGAILAVILCLGRLGGVNVLRTSLPESFFSMTAIGKPKIVSWLIASVLGACTAQAGLQPILAAKDEQTAVRSSFMTAALIAPFGVLMAILGMIARVTFPELENAKNALPTLLLSLPAVSGGFIIASIMAAILSTASPIFLACGTLFSWDIYGDGGDDIKALRVSRMATFFAGAVCIVSAAILKDSSTILDMVYFAYSLRGSLFVILLFGVMWKRTTSRGAVAAMVLTAVMGFAWVAYKKVTGSYPIHPEFSETYIAIITAALSTVTFSILSKDKGGEENVRKPIVRYVYEYSVSTPDKVAVITGEGSTTYRELFSLVNGYSRYLEANGLHKGDIVVTRASQGLDYAVLYLAVHLMGGVVASLERSIPEDGLSRIARHLGAKAVIGGINDSGAGMILPRGEVLPTAKAFAGNMGPACFPDEDDLADILFTTGTTGESKGVELTHKALTATAENLIYGCGYSKDTVMILPGPLNHANAIRKLFTTFVNGSSLYILDGMTNMNKFFDALDYPEGRIACCLPPAAIRMIFQITRDMLGKYADRIDFIESATAPLPEPDKERLCRLLPKTRLYNNYGSSEAASVCMYDYNHEPGRHGCVGKPAKNAQILVVDEKGVPIASSKENMGLIACKGEVNMRGYFGDPDATRKVLRDGVVYTNDVGYIDKDGFVYVTGRKSDVINIGGLKVAPTEVESATLEYDGVEDCICIGVDNYLTGKTLKLLVVMRQGEEIDPQKLHSFLLTRLESYKVPLSYEQVPKVERTFNGKINRKAYQ